MKPSCQYHAQEVIPKAYLELVEFGSIQDAILVRVAELEYSSKRCDTILLEDL